MPPHSFLSYSTNSSWCGLCVHWLQLFQAYVLLKQIWAPHLLLCCWTLLNMVRRYFIDHSLHQNQNSNISPKSRPSTTNLYVLYREAIKWFKFLITFSFIKFLITSSNLTSLSPISVFNIYWNHLLEIVTPLLQICNGYFFFFLL